MIIMIMRKCKALNSLYYKVIRNCFLHLVSNFCLVFPKRALGTFWSHTAMLQLVPRDITLWSRTSVIIFFF